MSVLVESIVLDAAGRSKSLWKASRKIYQVCRRKDQNNWWSGLWYINNEWVMHKNKKCHFSCPFHSIFCPLPTSSFYPLSRYSFLTLTLDTEENNEHNENMSWCSCATEAESKILFDFTRLSGFHMLSEIFQGFHMVHIRCVSQISSGNKLVALYIYP